MTKVDQIKILDDKIKANRVQFMLDRKNAEISAKSSGQLDKFEYLTGKDLGYKPHALTQAKFEYSPLGKVFTPGLDKDDKKDGLFKRLRSIENKSGIPGGFFPQLPYYERGANRIGYPGNSDKKDDDDDDDDDDDGNDSVYKRQYKMLEDIKEKLEKEDLLEKLANELFNRLAISSFNLEDKKYVIGRDENIYSRLLIVTI